MHLTLQSLLRGRFLRNERPVEEERPPSMAASELIQLRQRHTVSGLRYEFFHSCSHYEFFEDFFTVTQKFLAMGFKRLIVVKQ